MMYRDNLVLHPKWVASIIILLPVLCMSRSIDNWSSRFQFENKNIQFNTLHCKTEENSPFKNFFFQIKLSK
jgi:hypothetical protein